MPAHSHTVVVSPNDIDIMNGKNVFIDLISRFQNVYSSANCGAKKTEDPPIFLPLFGSEWSMFAEDWSKPEGLTTINQLEVDKGGSSCQ